jgi:acyl-[acyl-carrier-protein] desaturase
MQKLSSIRLPETAFSYLRELEPVAAKLMDRHLSTAKEWFPHEYVPWDLGRDFNKQPWRPED